MDNSNTDLVGVWGSGCEGVRVEGEGWHPGTAAAGRRAGTGRPSARSSPTAAGSSPPEGEGRNTQAERGALREDRQPADSTLSPVETCFQMNL